MEPIWKDNNITLSGDHLDFYISKSGSSEILDEGRVDAVPGYFLTIPANVLCSRLLDVKFPSNTGLTTHPEACGTFVFYNAHTEDQVGDVDFIYDWSWEDVEFGNNMLTKPINGHMDPRMRFFATAYNYAQTTMHIEW